MITYAFAQNPAVGGMPVSDSRNRNIRTASTGSRRIEPGERREVGLVTPSRRWSAAITANAPRFMNAYAAP